ncbi:uracil-DNA glycosylase [Microvirga alba]|uniref:Uracil-DNA glycosylase n=1 Tax=Microvirga alba TaxID=2791025 RepID=A0A931FRN6_9HYPH|nr:uracil-DNA glycosylase [Microvirga alba]MBF9234743.1 uracil-DNA glycosylase [Microvirga alba]
MSGPFAKALADFRARQTGPDAWTALPFFTDGSADLVAARVDAVTATGAHVLPPPEAVFNSLALTPLDKVKVVILGQDPYPTPGDAHGLAFSYRGSRRLPASLRTILAEMAEDLGEPMPKSGDLTKWAKQGVLLLNTALTVEAGKAGAHLKLGWSALVDQAVSAVSERQPAVVFLLWGGSARKHAAQVDQTKHLVIETGHPSPLNRLRDFRGTRPFSRANEWLAARGLMPVDWRLA